MLCGRCIREKELDIKDRIFRSLLKESRHIPVLQIVAGQKLLNFFQIELSGTGGAKKVMNYTPANSLGSSVLSVKINSSHVNKADLLSPRNIEQLPMHR